MVAFELFAAITTLAMVKSGGKMKNGILFGNGNAEHDDLLFECKIENKKFDPSQHRIIVGKWGAGKSAELFLINEKLSKEISSQSDGLDDMSWYIQEGDLNFSELFKIASIYTNDMRELRKHLEQIWYPDILRRAVLLLGRLDKYYGNIKNEHWNSIRRVYDKIDLSQTLWNQLPRVMSFVTSENKAKAIQESQADIAVLFQNKLFKHIQHCLNDIKKFKVQPIVAIEPLETPNSELDKQMSLAQEVVFSLLNVFEKKFQPSQRQLLNVFIAVPDHRYKFEGINLPQKLSQYKCNLKWDKVSLFAFINERIAWEFRNNNRVKFDKANAWYDLFDKYVERDNFEIPIKEDTFDYALRFTHHRPRDLQTLAMMAVQVASVKTNKSKNEILKGIGGFRICGSHLRRAIHQYRQEACDLLMEEYRRGYPGLMDIVSSIKGLPARFGPDDLYRRLRDVSDPQKSISELWKAGIIGIELCCNKQQRSFESMVPQEAIKTDKNIQGGTITRGYLFEYNYDKDIQDILSKFKSNTDVRISFVCHPKCYDTIIGKATLQWPIGV